MQVVVKAKYYIHTYGLGSITWEKRLQYVWWTINQGQAEYYVHSSSSTTEEPRERRIMIKRAKKRTTGWIRLPKRRSTAKYKYKPKAVQSRSLCTNKADKWVNWRTATFSSPLASFYFFSLSPIYASLVGQQPKTKNLSCNNFISRGLGMMDSIFRVNYVMYQGQRLC